MANDQNYGIDSASLENSPIIAKRKRVVYQTVTFNLAKLKVIVQQEQIDQPYNEKKHRKIITMLEYAAKNFKSEIPKH